MVLQHTVTAAYSDSDSAAGSTLRPAYGYPPPHMAYGYPPYGHPPTQHHPAFPPHAFPPHGYSYRHGIPIEHHLPYPPHHLPYLPHPVVGIGLHGIANGTYGYGHGIPTEHHPPYSPHHHPTTLLHATAGLQQQPPPPPPQQQPINAMRLQQNNVSITAHGNIEENTVDDVRRRTTINPRKCARLVEGLVVINTKATTPAVPCNVDDDDTEKCKVTVLESSTSWSSITSITMPLALPSLERELTPTWVSLCNAIATLKGGDDEDTTSANTEKVVHSVDQLHRIESELQQVRYNRRRTELEIRQLLEECNELEIRQLLVELQLQQTQRTVQQLVVTEEQEEVNKLLPFIPFDGMLSLDDVLMAEQLCQARRRKR